MMHVAEDPQCWPVGRADGLSEIVFQKKPGQQRPGASCVPTLRKPGRVGSLCGALLRATRRRAPDLLADAELGNDGFVALGIVFLEVVEQATPLADQH